MDSLNTVLEEQVEEVKDEDSHMGEKQPGFTIHKDCTPPPAEDTDKDNTELLEE